MHESLKQILEGILEEIDELITHSAWPNMNLIEKRKVEEIIQSHMNDIICPYERAWKERRKSDEED